MVSNPIKHMQTHLAKWTLPAPLRKPLSIGGVIFSDAMRADLLKQASAMAYVTLLSLIPSLVAVFCVFSLFTPLFMGQRDPVQEIKSYILSNLTAGSGSSAVNYLEQMLDRLDLKTIGWSSFASVLVTLIMLLRQIEIAINGIWFVKKPRNAFIRFMYFWTFLTLSMLVAGALIGLSIPSQLQNLISPESFTPQSSGFDPLFQWLLSFSASTFFFFLLYKVIPNCKVSTKAAVIGASVAAISINAGSNLYGIFVRDSASYKTLYGALAQLPIFLMWLYVCWTVILLGALISWRVQEGFPSLTAASARDATRSPEILFRNLKIRCTLPPLALMAICRNFLDASGQGLSIQQFAHHFDVPLSWAHETFELLLTKGFIHATKIGSSTLEQLEVTDLCMPAFPPEKTLPETIAASLKAPLDQWFHDHRHTLGESTQHSLKGFDSGEPLANITFKDLAEMLPNITS